MVLLFYKINTDKKSNLYGMSLGDFLTNYNKIDYVTLKTLF